jgi:methenyltetrahydromethanopterin cyclohydrolase
MTTKRGVRLALRAAGFSMVIAISGFASAADAPSLATLGPQAIAWAQQQAEVVARTGRALTPEQVKLARAVGVQDPARIRVLTVEQFPLPQQAEVKAAALRIGLGRPSIVGLTLGSSVMVRRGFENDTQLLSHELRHVAQYEARGGIAPFLAQHLQDLARYGYEDSPFEVDARAHEVTPSKPGRS